MKTAKSDKAARGDQAVQLCVEAGGMAFTSERRITADSENGKSCT